jgi:hypothetical protein
MNSQPPSTPVLSLSAMERIADEFDRRHPSPDRAAMVTLLVGPRAAYKERLARLIHATGERRTRPFVSLDCSPRTTTEFSDVLLRNCLVTVGRGAIYLDHLTAAPDSPAALLLTAIARRGGIGEMRRVPAAFDLQVLASADVLWCDARQDEIAMFSVPVPRLIAFLSELGVGAPFPPKTPRFQLPDTSLDDALRSRPSSS